MKTRGTLIRMSLGIFASGLFGIAALAGPPPQFWNRPAAKSPSPATVANKTESAKPAKCDGWKTTPIWVAGDRLPAGKGVGVRVVGSKHECTGCTGAVVKEHATMKDTMTHNTRCQSLLCCR